MGTDADRSRATALASCRVLPGPLWPPRTSRAAQAAQSRSFVKEYHNGWAF